MTMQVLAIQNEESDPPGLVADWLAEVGVQVSVCRPFAGDDVPQQPPHGYGGVLVLGGSMGALDDHEHPWLAQERDLLRECVAQGVPVFGICLGGQLLAAAMGATVERSPNIEIGVVDVAPMAAAIDDEVFHPVSRHPVPATQWHQDWIRDLPETATVLMSNAECPVQAFRVGSAYGVQFHPEVDAATFATWEAYADEAGRRSGIDLRRAVADVTDRQHVMVDTWRPVFHRWGQVVRGT